ncbi:tetratricopeptide repeat protein [Algirhabdus cladophorae]|uniref:tetratricopeptide repeat protein n=1 Tax=Algirhabdus cladophorae TaxID=3377108 RepID=UPI003B848ED3
MKYAIAFWACMGPFAAVPAWADMCPAVPDTSAAQAEILLKIQSAPSERDARPLAAAMWAIWAKAPDAASQELLDTGMERLRISDFGGAIVALDALVEYCPAYAEGYNQRAFVNFLQNKFEPALVDLDKAIARNPTHVAAIAGKALTLIGMGREDDAQEVLREALDLNPWLSERRLLKGTDL